MNDGCCGNAEWCIRQTAIPNFISQDWARIQDDLRNLGCAGFEVQGQKYVLYGVSTTAQTWAAALEGEVDE